MVGIPAVVRGTGRLQQPGQEDLAAQTPRRRTRPSGQSARRSPGTSAGPDRAGQRKQRPPGGASRRSLLQHPLFRYLGSRAKRWTGRPGGPPPRDGPAGLLHGGEPPAGPGVSGDRTDQGGGLQAGRRGDGAAAEHALRRAGQLRSPPGHPGRWRHDAAGDDRCARAGGTGRWSSRRDGPARGPDPGERRRGTGDAHPAGEFRRGHPAAPQPRD